MQRHPELSFTVGMPNMAPDQLSEVELLKLFAEFQWEQIGQALDCPPHLLASEEGERLYPSVIQFEEHFGSDSTIAQFREGDPVHARGHTRFYAKHFVEGWALFDKKPVSADAIAAIESPADLTAHGGTWISMTNAMVARFVDNSRLKTLSPAGMAEKDVVTTSEKPSGIAQHEAVLQTGEVEPFYSADRLREIVPDDPSPIRYGIELENDINGAGLLYFARYVAMMNRAERVFLRERLSRPVSQPLVHFLSTWRRRTYIFSNAPETDGVLLHVRAHAADLDEAPRRHDPLRTEVLRLQFDFELHRESDGVLMARSVVAKSLSIPNRYTALQAEARRFAERLRSA